MGLESKFRIEYLNIIYLPPDGKSKIKCFNLENLPLLTPGTSYIILILAFPFGGSGFRSNLLPLRDKSISAPILNARKKEVFVWLRHDVFPFHSISFCGRSSLGNWFLFGWVQQAVRQPKAVGAKWSVVLLSCFCPHCPPFGCCAGCHTSCCSPNLRSGSYLCSMVSFIPPSFTFTTVLLSFASLRLSTTSVSFRPSVFQHTIAHPLPIIFACLSACFGCGFVILFAKKKEAKRYAKPLRDTVLPHALRAFGSPPLQAHAPSSVSNSIGFIPARFAFGGQVCHLGSTAFLGSRLFLPKQKKERIIVFLFSFSYHPLGQGACGLCVKPSWTLWLISFSPL